ncbi:hypothetical protein [Winogradskyella wichelsiae]|uniref:hypothetical protein n=1 Tax=Winogradskyella wichelsiae TaxID=2697007 RepID=UPI0015CB4980|nr:hypothetical protein [Winogradskyella wichelsiae]
MKIQFNINKTIAINEKDQFYLKSLISGNLENYDTDILEIKVHLSDENVKNIPLNSMKCSLNTEVKDEAFPLIVSCKAENFVLAILMALNKLRFSLDGMSTKLKNPIINFMIPKKNKCLALI